MGAQAQKEVQELRAALEGYDKDKESLARVTLQAAAAEKRCRNVEWDFEVRRSRILAIVTESEGFLFCIVYDAYPIPCASQSCF